MKPQITNTALASFLFWAEHEILEKGEAYKNNTSKLYYYPDSRLNGYVAYGSPYKQWVYDRSISGAYIISGISGSISLTNYQSGMQIDYENGRILLPTSFGTGLNISGSYSFKEINSYISNETEESLIVENKAYLNSRFSGYNNTYVPPYTNVNPAMYFNILNNYNKPFELGGLKDTQINASIVIMTETMSQLDAALSIFSDAESKVFPLFSVYEDPLNEYGNVKTGLYPSGYNYTGLRAQKCKPGTTFFIESIRGSKLSDSVRANQHLFVGIIDAQISKVRYT